MENSQEVHVARQPIFDRKQNVVAYELLFRGKNSTNLYDGTDGDLATQEVISNSFLVIGIAQISGDKKAFINFTENALKRNMALMLPKDLVAIEVLESVEATAEIIKCCKELKEKGYSLVLDDFVFSPSYMPLILLADIIKVDYRATTYEDRKKLLECKEAYSVEFLAEKIETPEEFSEALEMGFSYFQGYFFCKPVIVAAKNLPGYKTSYFHILQELNRPEVEFSCIEEIIRKDVSLSYKLLRFINSPVFGFQNNISSLRQALALLGQKEIIKWISLISLQCMGQDKPDELMLNSLIRAKFAEQIAKTNKWLHISADAFLMGMLSHIDALLGRSMTDILEEIGLDEEIKNALVGRTSASKLAMVLKIVQLYERANWGELEECIVAYEFNEAALCRSYREALGWAHDVLVSNQ